eukprot:EG_transcript_33872
MEGQPAAAGAGESPKPRPIPMMDDEEAFALEHRRLDATVPVLRAKEREFLKCMETAARAEDCEEASLNYIHWMGRAFCPFQLFHFTHCLTANEGDSTKCEKQTNVYWRCVTGYLEHLPQKTVFRAIPTSAPPSS